MKREETTGYFINAWAHYAAGDREPSKTLSTPRGLVLWSENLLERSPRGDKDSRLSEEDEDKGSVAGLE